MNHIQNKEPLLKHLFSILKPNGVLAIADWIYPSSSQKIHSHLVKETQSGYHNVLAACRFEDIRFRDNSEVFSRYVEAFLANFAHHKPWICKHYGISLGRGDTY